MSPYGAVEVSGGAAPVLGCVGGAEKGGRCVTFGCAAAPALMQAPGRPAETIVLGARTLSPPAAIVILGQCLQVQLENDVLPLGVMDLLAVQSALCDAAGPPVTRIVGDQPGGSVGGRQGVQDRQCAPALGGAEQALYEVGIVGELIVYTDVRPVIDGPAAGGQDRAGDP